jgi:hypothetical protein
MVKSSVSCYLKLIALNKLLIKNIKNIRCSFIINHNKEAILGTKMISPTIAAIIAATSTAPAALSLVFLNFVLK